MVYSLVRNMEARYKMKDYVVIMLSLGKFYTGFGWTEDIDSAARLTEADAMKKTNDLNDCQARMKNSRGTFIYTRYGDATATLLKHQEQQKLERLKLVAP